MHIKSTLLVRQRYEAMGECLGASDGSERLIETRGGQREDTLDLQRCTQPISTSVNWLLNGPAHGPLTIRPTHWPQNDTRPGPPPRRQMADTLPFHILVGIFVAVRDQTPPSRGEIGRAHV